METKKTWEKLSIAYPAVGLSHCLVQDKQLEMTHVVIYCSRFPYLQKIEKRLQYTLSGRSVAFLLDLNLRDSTAEDNV